MGETWPGLGEKEEGSPLCLERGAVGRMWGQGRCGDEAPQAS